MKIANRFNAGRFITVHDELWMDLCKLNTAIAKFNIMEEVISGKKYLINSYVNDNKYEVGFAAPIPEELLAVGVDLNRLSCNVYDQYTEVYETLAESLQLSSNEVIIADILFSHYLNNCVVNKIKINQISFKDIERYRGKSSVKRNEVIKDETFNSYRNIITSLCSKIVFLKTSDTFRDVNYGVNNKSIMQPLLTIDSVIKIGTNNFQFNYSFGNYGRFIRRSRRYSNLLPSVCYSYKFNQANKHRVAILIAQILFYAKYKLTKSRGSFYDCVIDAATMCEWTYGKYAITAKEFHKFRKYALNILEVLSNAGEITDYDVTATLRRGYSTKNNESYRMRLIKDTIKQNQEIGTLVPAIYESSDKSVSYPNISSYALFNLPAGSEDEMRMKCKPNDGCETKQIKEIGSLYKSLAERGGENEK